MTDEVLRTELSAFEQKYDLSSDEFYRKYQAGELDDSEDMVAWASYYQMSRVPAGKTSRRVKA